MMITSRHYSDSEFVSVDLNDDHVECDICHQATDERVVEVILSDTFTLFEGSYDKYSSGVTKVHKQCLKRWSDIIERNIVYSSNRSSSPSRCDSPVEGRNTPEPTKTVEKEKNSSKIKENKSSKIKAHEQENNQNNCRKKNDIDEGMKDTSCVECEHNKSTASKTENVEVNITNYNLSERKWLSVCLYNLLQMKTITIYKMY